MQNETPNTGRTGSKKLQIHPHPRMTGECETLGGGSVFDRMCVMGHRQITDAHLLRLAIHQNGRLAGLDQSSLCRTGPDARQGEVLLVGKTPRGNGPRSLRPHSTPRSKIRDVISWFVRSAGIVEVSVGTGGAHLSTDTWGRRAVGVSPRRDQQDGVGASPWIPGFRSVE